MVQESDLEIVQVSANAAEFLGLDDLIGQRLDALPGNLAGAVTPHLAAPLHEIPSAVRGTLGSPDHELDCLFHRPPRGGLVLELERAGPVLDVTGAVESALPLIRSAASLEDLADETASLFKEIAGYDRAMMYRFDEDGHGEILSERRDPELESYLGQRYPASDIPQIARRLYERNRVRVLANVADPRIPLLPRLSPLTGEDLDMSLCFLRAMSPIHVQYLQNMGVAATLVASLMVGGRLWGLVACHHYSPRTLHYELRAVCEILAENVATRITALESFAKAQAEVGVRRLEQRVNDAMARDGDWRAALFDGSSSLLHPVEATGAALLLEGEALTVGDVPGTQDIRRIAGWLDARPTAPVFATASLGREDAAFESLGDVASGVAAAPVSSSGGEYMLWFRPAQERTLTWGGDPHKPFVMGDDPADLSPRRSFAQWHEEVRGTSQPWDAADLAAAKLIGATVADVVLQSRAVRMLIARDQLEGVRRQVQQSGDPIILADPDGRILLTNEAFERLLRAAHPHLEWISDLPQLFAERAELRGLVDDLLQRRRPRRGEFQLRVADGGVRPLLIRADPVLVAPNRLLGFVILVSDLTERREADEARRRFQALVAGHPGSVKGGSADPTYQHLLAQVLSNAQLAAMEITDGVDPAHMPEVLESVRASVERMAELLEQLTSHAAPVRKR